MGQRALLVRVRDQPPILALDIEAEGPFAAVEYLLRCPVTLCIADAVSAGRRRDQRRLRLLRRN